MNQIQIGGTYRFEYEPSTFYFNDVLKYSGQLCKVMRVSPEIGDDDQTMYEVQFSDGTETDAYVHELNAVN